MRCLQAYEGLETAAGLREEYVFVPAKVREVYLAHLLEGMAARHSVRSAIVFCATCRRAAAAPVLLISAAACSLQHALATCCATHSAAASSCSPQHQCNSKAGSASQPLTGSV